MLRGRWKDRRCGREVVNRRIQDTGVEGVRSLPTPVAPVRMTRISCRVEGLGVGGWGSGVTMSTIGAGDEENEERRLTSVRLFKGEGDSVFQVGLCFSAMVSVRASTPVGKAIRAIETRHRADRAWPDDTSKNSKVPAKFQFYDIPQTVPSIEHVSGAPGLATYWERLDTSIDGAKDHRVREMRRTNRL